MYNKGSKSERFIFLSVCKATRNKTSFPYAYTSRGTADRVSYHIMYSARPRGSDKFMYINTTFIYTVSIYIIYVIAYKK